jgi:hypothetical protein
MKGVMKNIKSYFKISYILAVAFGLVHSPYVTNCSQKPFISAYNKISSSVSDTVKSSADTSITEIETIIYVPHNPPVKNDSAAALHDTTSKKDTSSVKPDTSSKTEIINKPDTAGVRETPPVKPELTMGPGVYRLIRIDSVVFAKSYLLILENFQQDTIFILSDRIVRHYDDINENYGEQVVVNNLYRLKFYKIDNMFPEKLGYRYRPIEHLEIRFGSIIFWTDQLIQVPIHYTSQLNGLYYTPSGDETIINLDKTN